MGGKVYLNNVLFLEKEKLRHRFLMTCDSISTHPIMTRAASHNSHGPWPLTLIQRPRHLFDWYDMPNFVSGLRLGGGPDVNYDGSWNIINNMPCRNPSRFLTHASLFGSLGLHLLMCSDLGWSRPFWPMRDLRMNAINGHGHLVWCVNCPSVSWPLFVMLKVDTTNSRHLHAPIFELHMACLLLWTDTQMIHTIMRVDNMSINSDNNLDSTMM